MSKRILEVSFVVDSSAAAQTLPHGILAAEVVGAVQELGGATAYSAATLAPTTGAPSASQIQFTGTPAAPSGTVTLSAAPAANGKLTVQYVEPGDIPADQ